MPRGRPRRPKWVTQEMHRAGAEAFDRILDRIDGIQQDLQDEAELELARRFHITQKQARILIEEDW